MDVRSKLAGTTVPLVRTVMTPDPLTLEEDARLSDAVALMEQRHIMHLPVLKDGKLVGLLSERHVRDAMPSILTLRDPEARRKALFLTHVSQVCDHSPPVVSPDTPVLQAIAAMRKKRGGSVVVVEGEKVAGIITSGDLITLLERLLS